MARLQNIYQLIFIVLPLIFLNHKGYAQTDFEKNLSYEEFLGYVKKHHPLSKTANLKLTEAEAKLLKARGGFDPKINLNYDDKSYKETNYWDKFDASFTVPTWFGIELQANYKNYVGEYLNPESFISGEELYSAGVNIDVLQNFFINERMAALQKAKLFLKETESQRQLMLNELITNATKSYLDWMQANRDLEIYREFKENAELRLDGIIKSFEVGDMPAIDTVEAKIIVQNRILFEKDAELNALKNRLRASNFLWAEDVPLEINENILPILPTTETLNNSLNFIVSQDIAIENHPKLKIFDAQLQQLDIEKDFRKNKLLPKLSFKYNFLSPDDNIVGQFNTENYKAAVMFEIPIFLRKERGDYNLAKARLETRDFERKNERIIIENKAETAYRKIGFLQEQLETINAMVENYQTMLSGEERKFQIGESSIFLINSREQKLIEAKLKQNEVEIKLLKSYVELYNVYGI